MSASKVIPVLSKNMAQALHYRRQLKEEQPDVEIIRIVTMQQVRGRVFESIHALPDWQEAWREDTLDLLAYCLRKDIPLIEIEEVE